MELRKRRDPRLGSVGVVDDLRNKACEPDSCEDAYVEHAADVFGPGHLNIALVAPTRAPLTTESEKRRDCSLTEFLTMKAWLLKPTVSTAWLSEVPHGPEKTPDLYCWKPRAEASMPMLSGCLVTASACAWSVLPTP